jgi:dTDP-4-amino-4,6-dideoxygalactose transaminase
VGGRDACGKVSVAELAAFGGPPRFAEPLHVGRPAVPDRDGLLRRFGEVLDRGRLTNGGPVVEAFERRVAAVSGVKHCVAMCSGTMALEMVVRALDMRGEVIVPSLTFVGTPNALQWQGVTPVFCDIDPATHNLDPARVAEAITPRTSGILGVHVWGRVCDVTALGALAAERGLKLVFDAAHAFNCSRDGKMAGGFGDAEVFSFHATKFVSTAEGGAVTTDDDALAARLRRMRNFGFVDYDRTAHLGVNGKLNELCAAVGLASLEGMEATVDRNRAHYRRYARELRDVPGLHPVAYDERERANFQYVVVEVDREEAGIDRDTFVQLLHAENVLARRYFHPGCHRMEPYRTLMPEAGRRLPETERVAARLLVLPTGPALEDAEVDGVSGLLRFLVANAPAIAARRDREPAP